MNKVLLFSFLFLLMFASCASKKQAAPAQKRDTPIKTTEQDFVLDYGFKYLNTPYRYGGQTPKGFDCSGFTSYVFNELGYKLNRSSRNQAEQFPAIKRKNLQKADLVFFEGRVHNGRVGHVGIVSEVLPKGEFRFVHASTSNGVIESLSTEPYWASRYIKAGRVIQTNNKTIGSNLQEKNPANVRNNEPPIVLNRRHNVPTVISNQYHIVKKGENLHQLSQKYDVSITTLKYLNNLKTTRLKPGQKLKLTDKGIENRPNSVENPTGTNLQKKQNDKHTLLTHTVKKGETLYSISRKYNMSVNNLKRLNKMFTNTIEIGQKLKVKTVRKYL